MQNDKFKGILGSKFETFGAEPTDALWGNINASLHEENKNRGVIWWIIGPGIAALLLISLLVYNSNNDVFQKNEMHTIAKNKLSKKEFQLNPIVKSSAAKSDLTTKRNNYRKSSYKLTTGQKEKLEKVVLNKEVEKSKEDFQLTELRKDKFTELEKIAFNNISCIETIQFPKTQMNCIHPIKKRTRRWEIGIGLMAYTPLTKNSININEVENFSDPQPDVQELLTAQNFNAQRPLGIDFYLGYNLNSNWKITGGLEYFRTSFMQKKEFENLENQPGQLIAHSIGIPIGIQKRVFHKKRFDFGMELNVINELIRVKQGSTDASSFITNDLSENKIDYLGAFDVGIVASYHLSDGFKIQLSPDLRWYFKNKINGLNTPLIPSLWGGGKMKMIWTI